MKTELHVLKLETNLLKAVIARAEDFVKAAALEVREACLAHLKRLPVSESGTGHRGVFLL